MKNAHSYIVEASVHVALRVQCNVSIHVLASVVIGHLSAATNVSQLVQSSSLKSWQGAIVLYIVTLSSLNSCQPAGPWEGPPQVHSSTLAQHSSKCSFRQFPAGFPKQLRRLIVIKVTDRITVWYIELACPTSKTTSELGSAFSSELCYSIIHKILPM